MFAYWCGQTAHQYCVLQRASALEEVLLLSCWWAVGVLEAMLGLCAGFSRLIKILGCSRGAGDHQPHFCLWHRLSSKPS